MTTSTISKRSSSRKLPGAGQLVLLPESAPAALTFPDVPPSFAAFLHEQTRPAWASREVPAHLLDPCPSGGDGAAYGPEEPHGPPHASIAALAPLLPHVRYRPLGNYVNYSVAREPAADIDVTRRRARLAMRAVMRRISRLMSKPQVKPASGKICHPQYTGRKCGMVPVPRARSGGVVNPAGHVQLRVGVPDEGGRV